MIIKNSRDRHVQPTLLSLLILAANASILPSAHAGGKPDDNTLPVIRLTASKDPLTKQLKMNTTATQGVVTQEQLATRPLLRPAEALETIPGVIVTQHSGDGKANQYFLRGFNLDHGTDFATSFDGVPINMVTHAHGQGYTDLNFLIPELIDNIRYHKGATDISDGDFASAGTAKILPVRELDRSFTQLTGGSNNYQRLLAAGSTELAGGTLLGAAEVMR